MKHLKLLFSLPLTRSAWLLLGIATYRDHWHCRIHRLNQLPDSKVYKQF